MRPDQLKEFPPSWTIRLNEIVRTVRRQQRWGDVLASVEHPSQVGKPPVLRLEQGGILEVIPLSLPAVNQTMVTGQHGPLLIEIKQAFMRFAKTVERQSKLARLRTQQVRRGPG